MFACLFKMNNTTLTVNEEMLLEDLNNNKAVMMIPAFVYLGILMLVGLSGNILVSYYYGWKSRPSTNNTFILCVAMYDLILCTLSIPIETVDIRFFYNFPYAGACKVMRFINYFAAIGSVFTLIVISLDRYRKICRPFKKQFQALHARIACGLSVPFSLFFAWPAALFYTSVPVEITTDDGVNLTGFDCTTTKEPSYKIYQLIFNGFFLVCFIFSTIFLFTMYALIGRAIYKHQKSQLQNTRRKSSVGSHKMSHYNSPKIERKDKSHDTDGDVSATGSSDNTHIVPIKAKDHVSVKTIKFTTVMFVITLVFVISFLPHLALILWRTFHGEYEAEMTDGAGLVAYQIGLRSYFLNSAINPLTYGFFNSKFRAFFCSCCRRFTDKRATSSSSGTTMQFQMHSITSN